MTRFVVSVRYRHSLMVEASSPGDAVSKMAGVLARAEETAIRPLKVAWDTIEVRPEPEGAPR